MSALPQLLPPDAPDRTISILIVDDEPTNLLVLETVLDDPSYRLVKAESADEALHALVREEFALLILDVRMPGMTGFELAQMVKERRKTSRVPIIFLTAYYDKDQHILEGYETGAVDFLNKPVNPSVLRSKVAVFADLHRKTHELTMANRALVAEVSERRRAEELLRQLNDTLEQRVAERSEALIRADARLKNLMNSITDGLLTLDAEWCFSYSNEQGARLLGVQPESLLQQHIWTMFPMMAGTAFEAGMCRAVETRETVSFEALYPLPHARWFRCHCYPSEDGLSVYFHDVTDRRTVERRREELLAAEQAARNEGERVARAKDEFLALLSHELRTPLSAMLGWAAVLQRPGTDDETLRRGIDAMARNAQAQSHLVADLLEMSRIIAGKLRMNVARVDLNTVALATAETSRPVAQAKGVGIVLDLAPAGAEVQGDGARLEQVVTNLLTNALKFTPPGGIVTLTTWVDDADAYLAVADTGQGIAADFLPYLFDRFSQADGSAARLHGGLGLGLSIVRHLVELHHGAVIATSPGVNRGATFTLRLPRPAAQAPGASQPSAWAAPGVGESEPVKSADFQSVDLGGVRLLMVDDHQDVLEVESRLLGERGAMVRTARSAEEALQRLTEEPFDVLLSDLGMPGMDGYALIEHIRNTLKLESRQLPAAAVTAFIRPEDRDRALQVGYQAFVQKPVSADFLARTVIELLREADGSAAHMLGSRPTGVSSHQFIEAGASLAAASGNIPMSVLFVEDNVDLRELFGMLFEEIGLTLVTCGSGEEAEEEIGKGSRFDLVVTDVGLPGISGIELARRILKRSPMAWVVFLTGYPLGRPLDEFGPNVRSLAKPFEIEDLQLLLDEIRSSPAI